MTLETVTHHSKAGSRSGPAFGVPAADPLGPTMRAVMRENRALRVRLAQMLRAQMPKPIRGAHVDELLNRAALEADGATVEELLADVWGRFVASLDEIPQHALKAA